MFQDISPYHLDIRFREGKIKNDDYAVLFKDDKILLRATDGSLPTFGETQLSPEDAIYLLSVGETGFYLFFDGAEREGFTADSGLALRTMQPSWLAFAAATAMHLARWYDKHRFCGRCSASMGFSTVERAVVCPECKNTEYPKISPVIIVGITDGDMLLLTKYAHAQHKRYALVAGFMEIGETFEDTVRREVMEEVGLRVKNIRYYKSQPWAFSESVLAGFYAEVDGSREISLDENELAVAEWVHRSELPQEDLSFSLTGEIIERFRCGMTEEI